MEQNLVQANGSTLAKSTIASYIHDMKELEQQQFTLRETHAKCVSKRQSTDETAKQKMREAENTYQQANVNLNKALKNRIPEPKEVIQPSSREYYENIHEPSPNILVAFLYIMLCAIAFTIIMVVIATMTGNLDLLTSTNVDINSLNFNLLINLLIGIPLILGIFLYARRYKKIRKRYFRFVEQRDKFLQYRELKPKYDQQEQNISYWKNQLHLGKKMLEEAKQYQHDAQMQIENLDRMAEFLSLHVAEIEERKNRLYTVGIVPPDYRKLDCLIEFDQMFRNDLVDTVREAVKIYEERVFRGELVRGIDNIYNMLGNLSASMHNIENTLYGIQSEVRLMSDEIYNISAATESFQSNMLSESRAARYATEALQKSQEKCESYLRSQYYNI